MINTSGFLAFLLVWCIYFCNLFDISFDCIEVGAFKLFGFLQEWCLLYVTKDKMWNFLKCKSRFIGKWKYFIWVFVVDQNENVGVAIFNYLFSFSEESSLFDVKCFILDAQLFVWFIVWLFFFSLIWCLCIIHLISLQIYLFIINYIKKS